MGRKIDFILYFWSTTTKGWEPHLNSNFFSLFRVAHYGRLNATMTPIVFVIKRRKKNFLFSWQSRVLFHYSAAFFPFVGTSRKKCFLSTSICHCTFSNSSLPLSHSKVKNKIRIFFLIEQKCQNALEWRWKRRMGKKTTIWSPLTFNHSVY